MTMRMTANISACVSCKDHEYLCCNFERVWYLFATGSFGIGIGVKSWKNL